MGIWRLRLTPFIQRTQLWGDGGVLLGCHQLPSSQCWNSSSVCSRKPSEHFPLGATAQRDPLGRDRAFLRKRGVKVGVWESHQKKKIVAGPGMCLGESEPSLLSHPQLCRLGRGARHRTGQVTLRTGHQLPTCSWWAGRLPASNLVEEELSKRLSQESGHGALPPHSSHQPGPQFPHLCNDKIWRDAETG